MKGDKPISERLKQALPETNVIDKETVARNDVTLIGGSFSIPLRLMVLIAVGIGALLVGLTIYSLTVERVREYGVLKAIGMGNRRLYGVIMRQALVAAAVGVVASLPLTLLVAAAIQATWPQFLVVVDQTSIFQAAGGGLLMALIAALLPARYAASVDPAEVFRR